jgi:hypothetical protein
MSSGCRFAVDCCPEAQWIIDGAPGPSQPALAVAAAPGGTVLGLIPRDETFYVARVTPEGVSAPVAVGPDGWWHPQTLVVARSGAIYVLAGSRTSGMVVIAFDANGQVTGTHPMPGAASIDLAADQCTLWSAGDGIRRYNVCTGTPLPDFLTGWTSAVRVLVRHRERRVGQGRQGRPRWTSHDRSLSRLDGGARRIADARRAHAVAGAADRARRIRRHRRVAAAVEVRR